MAQQLPKPKSQIKIELMQFEEANSQGRSATPFRSLKTALITLSETRQRYISYLVNGALESCIIVFCLQVRGKGALANWNSFLSSLEVLHFKLCTVL